MKRVFVTGASGCVGHYVVEALLARGDCELTLLMRDPARFRFALPEGVRLLRDDMVNVAAHTATLAEMDAVVHLATAWGDPISYPVNVDGTLAIARALAPHARMLYFSTASILDEENRPMPVAESEGTDYIRSKYLAHQALGALPNRDQVITLFPTLIFGGSERHPVSHLSKGLPTLRRFIRPLNRLTLEGTLHFIHAQDIARIVAHLIDHPAPAPDLVLGNAPTSIDALVGALCEYYRVARGRAFDLTPLAGLVAALAGDRMNSWDRYSIRHKHFRYQAVNPRSFGLEPGFETIAEILDEARAQKHVGL